MFYKVQSKGCDEEVMMSAPDEKDQIGSFAGSVFERILYVERITADNLKMVLLGESSTYTAGLTGLLEELGVQEGWVVASHTFQVEEGGTAALLTVILERRRP
jgi:hypothetical protein